MRCLTARSEWRVDPARILTATREIGFAAATPVAIVLMRHPRSGPGQWIMPEEYSLNPHVPVLEYTVAFGNLCQRLVVEPGPIVVRSSCPADVADEIDVDFSAEFVPVQNVPETCLPYLRPSRHGQSDLLNATAFSIVGNAGPGYPQGDREKRGVSRRDRLGVHLGGGYREERDRSVPGFCPFGHGALP